jgi:predicted ATPase with chaperone activity
LRSKNTASTKRDPKTDRVSRARERAELDPLDLEVDVLALTSQELLGATCGEPSADVRGRVLVARDRQRERGTLNASLSNAAPRRHCALDAAGERLVRKDERMRAHV